jgi:hypothetical protein
MRTLFPLRSIKSTFYIYIYIYTGSFFSLSLFLVTPTWSIGHPWNALFHFSFLILRRSVGIHERDINPTEGPYLYKRRQTFIPSVGFEPTITVFKRAKKIYTLNRAETVSDTQGLLIKNYSAWMGNVKSIGYGTHLNFWNLRREPSDNFRRCYRFVVTK